MSAATVEKPTNGAITPDKPREMTPFERTKSWLQSEQFAQAVGKSLPKHMTPDRFMRIALTAVMKTPKLAQCTQESIFNCLLQLSQYGLEPDGRNAHLIPFDVKRKQGDNWIVDHTDCTLIIDFKGYAELVMRSGLVSSIHADIVCENDEFEYDRGFITRHRIDFKKPRGAAYAAYAVIRFKDGTEKCEVMPKDDILAIRDRSQGWIAFKKGWAKQSPWNPAEPVIEHEMWKKTAFRRVTKWVPLSAEIREVIAKEDDAEDRVRLLDLRETTVPEGKSKTDALVELMEQRRRLQEAEDQTADAPTGEESQDTDPARGEESQDDPPESSLIDQKAAKISAAIKAAVPSSDFDALHSEISLIGDDDIRVALFAELDARMVGVGAKKRKSGTLPGT